MKRAPVVALVLLALSSPAWARGDHDRVVRALEARYGVRHHGVPLLWLARLFVSGAGAGGLKLAIFEDVPARDDRPGRLEDVVRESLGEGWSPFVSVESADERTVVFVRPHGRALTMLVATADGDELVVVQMDVHGESLREWVTEPVERSRREAVRGD